MSTSFLVNLEGINISRPNFDNLGRDPIPLFQQQLCAAGISLSIPVETSGLHNTAIAPSPLDVSLVISSRFVDNCSSNPMQAKPLHALPTLQPITAVTTLARRCLTAPISTYSSHATKILPTNEHVVSVESRGTVFLCNPSSQTAPYFTGITTTSCQQNLLSINAPTFMPTMGQAAPVAPVSLTVQELAQLLAASKKDHLPEWNLSQNNGDPLQ